MRFVKCTVNLGFLNGKIPNLRQKIIFFITLTKVFEVANIRFLANFRFLTLYGVGWIINNQLISDFIASQMLEFLLDG